MVHSSQHEFAGRLLPPGGINRCGQNDMATFFFRLSSRPVFAFVFDLFAHFLHCIAAAQFRSFIISRRRRNFVFPLEEMCRRREMKLDLDFSPSFLFRVWQFRYWIEYPSCHIGCIHTVSSPCWDFADYSVPGRFQYFFSRFHRSSTGKRVKKKTPAVSRCASNGRIRQSTTTTFSRDSFSDIIKRHFSREVTGKESPWWEWMGCKEEADPLVDMPTRRKENHMRIWSRHHILLSAPERVG